MVCRQFSAKSLSETMLGYHWLDPWEKISMEFKSKYIVLRFSYKKMNLKLLFVKWWPFCLRLNVLNQHIYTTVGLLIFGSGNGVLPVWLQAITWTNDELWRSAQVWMFNSLAPERPGCHFKTVIFNLVLLIGIFTSSNDNALRWMPWHLTDDKSTLVQVMAWCRQATSHYLSQCWPISVSP